MIECDTTDDLIFILVECNHFGGAGVVTYTCFIDDVTLDACKLTNLCSRNVVYVVIYTWKGTPNELLINTLDYLIGPHTLITAADV